jgi:hypothetical protein
MQILRQIRTWLGLAYARWRFRTDRDYHQPLTEFFRSARSILVVLPMGYEDANVAGAAFKRLLGGAANAHVTVVTTGIRATPLSDGRSEVIRVDEVDLNPFFLPRNNIMHRVIAHSYDLAVDLNLDFVLHAAYICKASRAPVRVGIRREHSDTFYNVQLNLDRSGSPQTVYGRFVDLLNMF